MTLALITLTLTLMYPGRRPRGLRQELLQVRGIRRPAVAVAHARAQVPCHPHRITHTVYPYHKHTTTHSFCSHKRQPSHTAPYRTIVSLTHHYTRPFCSHKRHPSRAPSDETASADEGDVVVNDCEPEEVRVSPIPLPYPSLTHSLRARESACITHTSTIPLTHSLTASRRRCVDSYHPCSHASPIYPSLSPCEPEEVREPISPIFTCLTHLPLTLSL